MKSFLFPFADIVLILTMTKSTRGFLPGFAYRKNNVVQILPKIAPLHDTPASYSTSSMKASEAGDIAMDGEEWDGDDRENRLEQTVESPEITSLKEEILKLEADLKGKKATLSYELERVDEYSKSGYARAVAEMENMRRVRSNMNSSSKSNAMAGVLKEFLPVYDKMELLKEKNACDEFGSKYGGLSMVPTFSKMGVKEVVISQGDPVDFIRMQVVGSAVSTAPEKTVLQVVKHGLELDGNIIRAAECIASLGEAKADEANEQDVADKRAEN